MKRFAPLPVLALALTVGVLPPGAPARADELNADAPPTAATPTEIRQGDQAAAELEKDPKIKFLDPKSSPEAQILLDKLNGMAKKLGAVSPRAGVDYRVRVIEDKDINAFTLPGGRIYMYRGLLDFTSSDDEIAGVLAHEIGHNTRLHALRGAKLNKKFGWVNLLALAGIIAGASNSDGRRQNSGAAVAQFSQYLLVGILNGYGVGFEKEADSAAIPLMEKAGYNPSALVTFMERLELRNQRMPQVNLGIFQTHPPSRERAEAARAELESEGIEFSPREVSGSLQALASETDGQWKVALGEVTLLQLSAAPDAQKRAEFAATRTNVLLRDGLKAWEMSARDGKLIARGEILASASQLDAKQLKLSREQIAQSWLENYRRLFWREQLNGKF